MEMASTNGTPCLGSEIKIDGKPKSPFKAMDAEIYLYRDIECTEKEKIRLVQHDLKVHEKSTFSSRARSRKALKKLEEAIERETKQEIEKETSALDWNIAFAKCIQSDKQSITDYINEQKELFLLEYAVKTKQHTISKLEEMVSEEERRAKLAETKIEDDTTAFDEFLKENDRSSVDALKIAAQEAKAKLEATAEVNSAMSELFSLKSEIANTEDSLKLSLSYEAFLLSVSPKEWQELQLAKKKLLRKDKKGDVSKSTLSFPAHDKSRMLSTSFILRHKINKWAHLKGQPFSKKLLSSQSSSGVLSETDSKRSYQKNQGGDYRFFKRTSRVSLAKKYSIDSRKKSLSCSSEKSVSASSEDDYSLEDLHSDEEPEIYFNDPEELLQLYKHLEEQNLSLFQNILDLSGILEDARQKEQAFVEKTEKMISDIVSEKKALIAATAKEEQKSADVELKIKMFTSGDYNPISTDKALNTLKKKITEVYRACCGTFEVASMTSIQMLKAIEIRVSELCEMLETLPPEYLETVEVLEKLRAKQRRRRVREDKLKELKRLQEERLKHALERAIAVPKTRVGRRLVYRSQPPETKRKGVEVIELTTKSEDDYYFS